MIKTSFINPFSNDSKEIVTRLGAVETLDNENNELISLITGTPGQKFGKDVNIPQTLKELAIHRFEWFLFRKTKDFDDKKYEYLFNPDIYEYDVVSFYLLCQAVAIGYGPDSNEAKQVLDSQREIVNQRLEKNSFSSYDAQSTFLRETLNQLVDTSNLYWTDIKHILELGEIDLNDLLLSKGKIIIEYEDFIEEFGHLIENRDPYRLYQVTCGIDLKRKLLISLILTSTKEYINTVSEMAKRMVEPNVIMLEIADEIRRLQKESQIKRFGGNSSSFMDDKPVPYKMKAFPPCVRKCMEGIKSGGRNDAIVLFLTPFISYSRLYPGIFSTTEQVKVSDIDPSLEITNNEVIPLIYEAAMACSPPLFKDQPQEKVNINSKLGFGMHSELKLEHEGETHWYTPMSCEKIKLHLSSLCVPNVDCKKIGNPLTYYNRKRRLLRRKELNQPKVTEEAVNLGSNEEEQVDKNGD